MPPHIRSLHTADGPVVRPSSHRSAMDPPPPKSLKLSRAGRASSPSIDGVILPKTCTPGYTQPANGAASASGSAKGKEKARGRGENDMVVVLYSDEAKDRLLQEVGTRSSCNADPILTSAHLHQILGFHPRTMLENIAEVSRKQIYDAVSRMETHLNRFVGLSGGNADDEGREIEIVSDICGGKRVMADEENEPSYRVYMRSRRCWNHTWIPLWTSS